MSARRIALIVLGAVLFIAPRVLAQEFQEFLAKEDLVAANFPGIPTVTNITWDTEFGAKLPARVYSVVIQGPQGTRKYVMTAVDYSQVKKIQEERAKTCVPPDARCEVINRGLEFWKSDVRGAMMFAATKYITSYDYHVTRYVWSYLGGQGMEVNELQAISTQDKSFIDVTIYMHHNRLYVMEETTPASYRLPRGLFVQSISLKESDGTNARHFGTYFNGPTVDPIGAKACTRGAPAAAGSGVGGNAGPRPNLCQTLPADVRFQQGPNFSIEDTTGPLSEVVPGAVATPAATEPRKN